MQTVTLSQVTDWAKLMPPLGISTRAKLAWRRFAVVDLNGVRFAFPAKGALAWLKSTGADSLTFDGYALRGQHGGSHLALLAYTTAVPCEEPYNPVGKSACTLGAGPILDRCELSDMVTETASTSTLAERKADAKAKRVDKARKIGREAVNALAKATTEASEAQAVLDSLTLPEAVNLARRCLSARRLYRAALAAPVTPPAWFPVTFKEQNVLAYVNENRDEWHEVSTLDRWQGYVADYQSADAALQAYKPRLSWPSYVASLADEAGMSLAAYKRANPDRAFVIRGPQYDKLREAKRKALDNLGHFITARFKEYLATQGLPDCLACKWSFMDCRPYSRARLHLTTWPQRKADLESRVFEARNAREKAEA